MSRGHHRQPRLDHIVVSVREWQGAEDFYWRVLGAVLASRGDLRAHWFGADGVEVLGHWRRLKRLPDIPTPPAGVDLCIEGPGPSATGGGRRPMPVRLHHAGGAHQLHHVSAWVRDPDGDLIELVSFRDAGDGEAEGLR